MKAIRCELCGDNHLIKKMEYLNARVAGRSIRLKKLGK